MDPLGFGRIVTDNWGILMMHPDAFSEVVLVSGTVWRQG